jgi:hypothetical protein
MTAGRLAHRVPVHTEWTLQNTGIHSSMMEKSALAGEGWDARPPPFTPVTITYKVAVYAPAERADTCTLTLFHLYPNTAICTPGLALKTHPKKPIQKNPKKTT